MSGWIFLAAGILVSAVDFIVGFNMTRASTVLMRRGVRHAPEAVEARRRFGLILMGAALVFLIVFAVVAFGIVPVGGIEPISFN